MSKASTFLIEPFDIMLHATEEGVQSLQARFSTWLRTLNSPARFICWQMPATLDEKINDLSRQAKETDDPQRAQLLMEYRRYYEQLDKHTGGQYNAKDLTWSYAETLSAIAQRRRALAAI